ncbi:hypothetical protein ACWGH7_33105 [Streptomyces cyaneofuscatus]
MTSATTQLTLSGPPEALARAMRSRTACSGSLISESTPFLIVPVSAALLWKHALYNPEYGLYSADLLDRHDSRQAVGAQQISVFPLGVVEAHVGVGVGSWAQGPHQERPLGVGGGFFRAEASFVDHRLDHGVVVGDLEQLSAVQ